MLCPATNQCRRGEKDGEHSPFPMRIRVWTVHETLKTRCEENPRQKAADYNDCRIDDVAGQLKGRAPQASDCQEPSDSDSHLDNAERQGYGRHRSLDELPRVVLLDVAGHRRE